MSKQIIRTKDAPSPVGPYSQAIRVGDFVFVSGQGPIDPKTGKIVSEDFEQQTIRTLENVKAILNSHGLELKDVVKTTVYLRDIENFGKMNALYSKYFGSDPPARTTIQAIPPGNIKIEIDAIAYLGKTS